MKIIDKLIDIYDFTNRTQLIIRVVSYYIDCLLYFMIFINQEHFPNDNISKCKRLLFQSINSMITFMSTYAFPRTINH